MNKTISTMFLSAIIAVFTINPLLGDTPTSAGREAKAKKAQALYDQGMKHYKGDGALLDYKRAFKLLKEAADLGHPNANYQLAMMYFGGQGCEANEAAAVKYATYAAANYSDIMKYYRANGLLGWLYFKGFEDENHRRIQDFNKAYKLFSNGEPSEMCYFFKGLMEYDGVGTEKNYEKAAESFFESCKKKLGGKHEGYAALCLGLQYYTGLGVEENADQCYKWASYGLKTAFPELVAEIKKPLNNEDLNEWKKLGERDKKTFDVASWKRKRLLEKACESVVYYKGPDGRKLDLVARAVSVFLMVDWDDFKEHL